LFTEEVGKRYVLTKKLDKIECNLIQLDLLFFTTNRQLAESKIYLLMNFLSLNPQIYLVEGTVQAVEKAVAAILLFKIVIKNLRQLTFSVVLEKDHKNL